MDKKSREAMSSGMEDSADEAGQSLEQPEASLENREELIENAPEKSPEAEIDETVGEIDHVDQEIFAAQKSIAETEAKLAELRESMGMPPNSESSPTASFQNEKIKQLEKRKEELGEEKKNWIEQHGRENLPDGIALDDEEGGREAKGGSLEKEEDQEADKKEKKEDLELRKKWIEQLKQDSVKHFEDAMRQDWRTKDAMNLDLTIELMKLRVPKAIDKEAEDFINGVVDEPPFSTVWIKWQTSSSLDRIINKPNWIGKLEITFDDEAQKIAEEGELKKEEEQDATKAVR
ncbi:MAG TPA: hypothetical protein VIJ29_02780 [Candidatus Paceibacterota bacterium]